jgi:hypothetical protein
MPEGRPDISLPGWVEDTVQRVMLEFGGTTPQVVTSGEINHVIIVSDAPEPYVIKIPRKTFVTQRAVRGNMIEFEASILDSLLDHADTSPTPLPIVLEEDEDSNYLVLSYIPGHILDAAQLQSLSQENLQSFLKTVVSEVVWFAGALPTDNRVFSSLSKWSLSRKCVPDKRGDILDGIGFNRHDHILSSIGQYSLDIAAEEIFKSYQKLRNTGRVNRNIAGHNDRRRLNWVFDQPSPDARFIATVDYGNVIKTTYEQELRFIPTLGKTAVQTVAEAFHDLTGEYIDETLVYYWDRAHVTSRAIGFWGEILKAVSSGHEKQAAGYLNSSVRTDIARELIRVWPDLDWREFTGEITYENSLRAA